MNVFSMYVFFKRHQHPAIPEPAPLLLARFISLSSSLSLPRPAQNIPAKKKKQILAKKFLFFLFVVTSRGDLDEIVDLYIPG